MFINTILGILAVCCFIAMVVYFTTVGMKSTAGTWLQKVKNILKLSINIKSSGDILSATVKNMETVAITLGKCNRCGKTFVGTTGEDDNTCLQSMTLNGTTKVFCKNCCSDIQHAFDMTGESDDVEYSERMQKIRALLLKNQ